MRISDWSSDVCSSDLLPAPLRPMMPSTSPARTLSETSSRAATAAPPDPAKRLLTRSKRMIDRAAPPVCAGGTPAAESGGDGEEDRPRGSEMGGVIPTSLSKRSAGGPLTWGYIRGGSPASAALLPGPHHNSSNHR